MAKDVIRRALNNIEFEPPRSSTPSSKAKGPGSTSAKHGNSTFSSAASSITPLPELTPEQIDIIDAIIKRAPENTTTFLAVYKAYEEVLEQRGIESTPDVNYYKILLQIGVIKAQYWKDRWRIAKEMLGSRSMGEHSYSVAAPNSQGSSFLSDSLISHSEPHPAISGTPGVRTSRKSVYHTPRPVTSMSAPLFQYRASTPTKSDKFSGGSTPLTAPSVLKPSRNAPLKLSPLIAGDVESDVSYRAHAPQSNHASEEDDSHNVPGPSRPFNPRPVSMDAIPRQHSNSLLATKPFQDRPTSSKGRLEQQPSLPLVGTAEKGANGHDFWEVEEMEQTADDFRQELLLRHCLHIWRDGSRWISTTLEQVSNARDHILLKSCFHEWLDTQRRRADLEGRVSRINDIRILRVAVRSWHEALEEKKRREFREGVRRRFILIRNSVDSRIKREVLKKWLLSFRYLRMEALLETNLQRRMLLMWRNRFVDLRRFEQAAGEFQEESRRFTIARIIDLWKRKVELRHAESLVSAVIARRTTGRALEIWLRTNLSRKVSIQVRRQNGLLLRAVFRVWVAKERGALLVRIRQTRLVLHALRTWHEKCRCIKRLNANATAFLESRSLLLFKEAYHHWHSRLVALNASLASAQVYYTHHLMVRKLHTWRAQRKFELRRVKQARIARRWFIKRACWSKWRGALEEKNRGRRLQTWNQGLLRRLFIEWQDIAAQKRRNNTLSAHIEDGIATRIQRQTLHHWMRRVIDFRERALRVQQIEEVRLRRVAFSKWVDMLARHSDDVALMQSFRDVKTEEFLRRALLHWIQAAQKSMNRRERLERKQDEMKLSLMSAAWDRWRDRFLEEKLHSIEFDVGRQMESNLLFRAFRLWESKTRSIPAIRLHATCMKRKALNKWHKALPRARLEHRARESERGTALRRAFQRWQGAYRAKMTLKAVAYPSTLPTTSDVKFFTTDVTANPPNGISTASGLSSQTPTFRYRTNSCDFPTNHHSLLTVRSTRHWTESISKPFQDQKPHSHILGV
ncbi:uncharacterized protein EI90DRAFT_3018764 [Cantharellus anzutake]|uniref:uncharacterized protein n=1 Tax=Cantharellus anzutake TaxID=1750568 RepID=UPI001904D4F4|nr:uncharacterized protein EI90DRAFT_3018764 [Cantharellus anzutake]KAF8326021.1 hypothetical protein EI90DRAFT_3018764 [Cantharellus anzutake]